MKEGLEVKKANLENVLKGMDPESTIYETYTGILMQLNRDIESQNNILEGKRNTE